MLSLSYECITWTSFRTIYVICSKTNKYIPFSNNVENNYISIIQYFTCIYIMHSSEIVYKAADINL